MAIKKRSDAGTHRSRTKGRNVSKKKRVIKKRAVKKKGTLKRKVTKKRFVKKKRNVKKKVIRKNNPIITQHVIKIVKGKKVYYFDGERGIDKIKDAAHYLSNAKANRIAQKVADSLGKSAQVFVEGTIVKK